MEQHTTENNNIYIAMQLTSVGLTHAHPNHDYLDSVVTVHVANETLAPFPIPGPAFLCLQYG